MHPIHYVLAVWVIAFLIEAITIYHGYKTLIANLKKSLPPEAAIMLEFFKQQKVYTDISEKISRAKKNPFVWLGLGLLLFEFAPIILIGTIYSAVYAFIKFKGKPPKSPDIVAQINAARLRNKSFHASEGVFNEQPMPPNTNDPFEKKNFKKPFD